MNYQRYETLYFPNASPTQNDDYMTRKGIPQSEYFMSILSLQSFSLVWPEWNPCPCTSTTLHWYCANFQSVIRYTNPYLLFFIAFTAKSTWRTLNERADRLCTLLLHQINTRRTNLADVRLEQCLLRTRQLILEVICDRFTSIRQVQEVFCWLFSPYR